MRNVIVLFLFPAVTTLFVLGAQAAISDDANGARLYHEFCSVCHGDKGDGKSRASRSLNPPPKDFSTPSAAGELSRERMIKSVTNGRPGTAMTAWKHQLSPSQIESIIDYVRAELMLGAANSEYSAGQRIYAEYCSVCHGDRGNGISRASRSLNPSPRDFTSSEAAQLLTRERMVFSVTYGRPNTAMAAWGTQLTPTQINQVVDFVRTKFMPTANMATSGETSAALGSPASGLPGSARQSTAMPLYLTGDTVWGNAFYDANCSTCHGFKGDGKGPRAYFIFPKPRDFREPAAKKLNREALFTAISKGSIGTEMPAWDKVLTKQEIANVAEYVFTKFIDIEHQQ